MAVFTLVAAAVGAVLAASVVSLAEGAFLVAARHRRRLDDASRPGALERAAEDPQRVVLAVLVVLSALGVAAAVAGGLAAVEAAPGAPLAGALGSGVALALACHGIVGVLVPRALGARAGERLARPLAPVLLGLAFLLAPVTWPLRALSREAHGAAADAEESHFRSDEELKELITLGTEEGILEETEEDLIHSVIEFGDTRAKEIMVARVDVVAVPGDATLEHVRQYVVESNFSRVPVYQGSLDNVVGVLYLTDLLLKLLDGKGATPVKELMREPFFVPETKRIADLLDDMRERRVHMAVVIDEFGITAGIITLEDILEEIVGEIYDEFEPPTEAVRKLDADTAVVDARTHVADVNADLGIRIPEDGPYDTIGGFLFHRLGRVGKEGEVVHHGAFHMIVEKASTRRILRVRVVRQRAAEEAPAEDAAEREA